jgi:acetyltransferase-like isoleucine patch superfamily enzyme
VIIREENIIGDNLCIWSNSIIDFHCRIGNNVKIHSNVYVSQYTTLEDNVFLAPGVCLANDIHPGCPDSANCMHGPHIKKGAQIGMSACILPRVSIGEYALVGAGSVVTHDVPASMVVYGNPARVMGSIEDLVCNNNLRDTPYGHLAERLQSAHTIS